MSGHRRVVAVASIGLLVTSLPVAGWSVHLGLSVRDHLEAARAALATVRSAAGARDMGRMTAALSVARREAAEARRLAGGVGWSLMTHVPLVADAATTVRVLAESVGEVADVLAGVGQAGRPFLTAEPRSLGDMGVLLADLRTAAPSLDDAVSRLTRARARLAAAPSRTGLDALDQARGTALREIDDLHGWVGGAATAAELLPAMLGKDGPRRYFLAFQTNAEARGTGGLVGAFGILQADRGRITVDRLSADTGLQSTLSPVADHGRAFLARYGPAAAKLLSVSNLSPHFPFAAATWTGLWERQTGRRLDGSIAIDPVGLSHLLALSGPVTIDGGEQVTAANVVDLTERTAYARYPDPEARKRFLITIARTAAEALSTSFADPIRLLPVLRTMAQEHRLQIWSRHEPEERLLSDTPLGGVLPEVPGPYAGLVVNNSAGGKLDYYLDRSLDYRLGPCVNGRRSSTVRVRLTNDVPSGGLPAYVTGRLDDQGHPHPVGSNLLWVSVYAGVGAELGRARIDGAPARVITEAERSHPVFSTLLELGPGQSRTLRLDLTEPASARPPTAPVQPLARSQRTTVSQDSAGCTP
ncbi:DUF4012 domain-containing protein [Planotetraspora silvatica]|uniref:DUF4012 domain-containing protein n=1 Tax=Planotetraspora silvatica TaxID=234614 RepID=UPI00194E092C|nr:DUF4012 domain-containing protein [Planotetraspora silvatica]